MDLVVVLKVVHVLAATVVVGANATYATWIRFGNRHREHLAFAIRGTRNLDKSLVIPAFGLLLLTGVPMVLLGVYDFTAGWLLVAIVLYLGLGVAGMTVMGPATRRLLRAAEADPDGAEYAAAERTTMRHTAASLAILLVIVVLMVAKPF